jgi:hypothetical protein
MYKLSRFRLWSTTIPGLSKSSMTISRDYNPGRVFNDGSGCIETIAIFIGLKSRVDLSFIKSEINGDMSIHLYNSDYCKVKQLWMQAEVWDRHKMIMPIVVIILN